MTKLKSMRRALIVGALAAACLPQAVIPASARSNPTKLQTLAALERLAAPRADPNAPTFTRSASVSVAGTVHIFSPVLAGPLSCSVFFFYFDPNTDRFFAETATRRVAVTGSTGTCNIKVPFRWQGVTDSSNNVGIFLEVANGAGLFAEDTIAQQPLRASLFPGPSLPLALEGEDVHVTFDIRM